MEIDYDTLQSFLSVIKESGQPTLNTMQIMANTGLDINNKDDGNRTWFYLKLLDDQDLIECVSGDENLGFSFTSGGEPMISIRSFRLTLSGHQILESMANETIWSKIKEPVKKAGIEGLKQIPGLAIKFFAEYVKNPH
jgi:hypothetical protein